MYDGHKKYVLFIGEWQPFHNGHKYLIDKALSEEKHVCIAIRDTEISKENPYTAKQQTEMIRKIYADKVKIIIIPDIKSINIGKNIGYDVNRIDFSEDIKQISCIDIRVGRDSDVPKEIAEFLKLLKTTLWFTGLPCSGKTTLAKRIKKELDNKGYKVVHLDADEVRSKLNADLGFSPDDRKENLRRVAHVAKLFNDNGNFVIASFVSPNDELRRMVKDIIGNFKMVFVKCSLETCWKRDIKGLYNKARLGQIKEFTGVSAPFEEPLEADIVVDTEHNNIEACIEKILGILGFHQRSCIS